jgi:hypothetical protein
LTGPVRVGNHTSMTNMINFYPGGTGTSPEIR